MGKLKDRALSGYNVDAVLEATGGELKGKGFRAAKRAANKQNRINKRAKRKAQRRGDQIREGYEGFVNDKEVQKVGKYFENLKTARSDKVSTVAAKTLAIAGTAVATAGLGSAIAANIATYGVLGAGGTAGAAAAAGAAGAAGAGAAAGGASATGLMAGTGATIGLGAGGASAATSLAGAGTAIGSAAAGTAGLAGASAGTVAAGTVAAGTAAAGTAGSFIPNALKTANQVGEIAGNVQKVAGAAQSVKTLLTPQQQQQQQQPEPQTAQGLGFNTYASQNSPSSNTGAYMVNPNSYAYTNNVYIPPNLA